MNANMYNTTMLVHFMENGYPDHYGGAYLDMETGHLVIKVKGLTPELEQYYYDLTGAELLCLRMLKRVSTSFGMS